MKTNTRDAVTGVVAEVDLVVDLPINQVWELVTDVTRIGEWSPECVGASWWPDASLQVGARFVGRNDYGGGFTSQAECVVTQVVRPSLFEWFVLDDDLIVDRPGSIWRYELEPDGDRSTRVLHRFTHGPGMTGLREGVLNRPEQAQAVLNRRLTQLRDNMTTTINAMARTGRAAR